MDVPPPNKRLKRNQDEDASAVPEGDQKQPPAASVGRENPGNIFGDASPTSRSAPTERSLQHAHADSSPSPQMYLHQHQHHQTSGSSSGGDILSNLGASGLNDLLRNPSGSGNRQGAIDLQMLLMLRASQVGALQQQQQQQHPSALSSATSGAASQLAELQALRLRAAGLGPGLLPTRAAMQESLHQPSHAFLNELRLRGSLLSANRNMDNELLERALQQHRQDALIAAAAAAASDYGSHQRQLPSFAGGGGGGSQDAAFRASSDAVAGRANEPFFESLLGQGSPSASLPFSSASGAGTLSAAQSDGKDSIGNLPANSSVGRGALDALSQQVSPKLPTQLPPIEEGHTVHFSQRICVPLAIDEDPNWLSERQCFIRSDLLEVVRASHEEVLVRSSSKSIAYQQVGIRCRYCAHMQPSSRAIRSSAYPSSIRQMYQSFTMMVRDHFASCSGIPANKKHRFLELKGLTSPSSSLSRQYWTFAAQKLGMVDSEYGIIINEETQAKAGDTPPFGTTAEESLAIKSAPVKMLLGRNDQQSISAYLYLLMSQVQMVHLLPSERVGKRKDAPVGLAGFGCIYCAKAGRLGFCRMFPLNKRSLPDKVNDLFAHLQRCPLCPTFTKTLLDGRRNESTRDLAFAERDREFIDRIWVKLGRDTSETFQK